MLTIYGSLLCPDCVRCCEELKTANIDFEYCDFAENLLFLKEFLQLRDNHPIFTPVRDAGKIGIPCILRDDGSLTLDWEEFLQ